MVCFKLPILKGSESKTIKMNLCQGLRDIYIGNESAKNFGNNFTIKSVKSAQSTNVLLWKSCPGKKRTLQGKKHYIFIIRMEEEKVQDSRPF